ncbi:MAG: TIM barrel protein [Planctomycetota bacterium]
MQPSRRTFLRLAAGASAVAVSHSKGWAEASGSWKFKMSLRCSSVGIKAGQAEAIRLAGQYGFEAVAVNASELGGLDAAGLESMQNAREEAGLFWGSAGLPVQFRDSEERFEKDLAQLGKRAAAAASVGVSRMGTYIMPTNNNLTFMRNMRLHSTRLAKCAKVINEYGLKLGLEYVGPKTLWPSGRYSFIHDLAGARDLIAEINEPNVGLILDSWHWYTAEETKEDLLSVRGDEVVACDLNDAPAGVPVNQQIDQKRELPVATGVIDTKTFLECLVEIGYDGPVRAEPFNAKLNALDNEAAAAATAKAMKSAFALIAARG